MAVLTLQMADGSITPGEAPPGVGPPGGVALSGSSIEVDVDVLANELLDELLNDCMSMSMQVAEIVEVVPNMLRPLSSLPLGS